MKTTRTFALVLALAGFIFSLIIHLLALWRRLPSSESWWVVPFLGALALFVSAAYLSGVKPGRMGMVPVREIVRGCPNWLKRTQYFFSAYVVLTCLWIVVRASGVIFHWRKIELSFVTGIAVFSALAMSFYVSSFSILFGRLFGDNRQDAESADATRRTT